MYNKAKKYVYPYVILIAVLVGLSVFLFFQVEFYNGLYSVHTANINVSDLCTANKTSMLFFYSDNCQSCKTEYSAFRNTTSLFGLWSGDRFYSQYFCAYSVNMSQYAVNSSDVFAPPESISIFDAYSGSRVPFIVFGGRYYKIGGFQSSADADSEILKYVCLSINSTTGQCS